MMTKPGITELDRCVDSRYTLVSMVAKRARMIGAERQKATDNKLSDGDTVIDVSSLDKPVSQAVGEISNGVIGYVRSAAVDRAQAYEEEKMNAISQMQAEAVNESNELSAE